MQENKKTFWYKIMGIVQKNKTTGYDEKRDRHKGEGSTSKMRSKRAANFESQGCDVSKFEYITKGGRQINASKVMRIPGHSLIATQCPKLETIDDFLDLIFTSKIDGVVSLISETEELDTNKAFAYWNPNVCSQYMYRYPNGMYQYVNWPQQTQGRYAFNVGGGKICVCDLQSNRMKTCDFYHYSKWPDKGSPTDLDDFEQLVTSMVNKRKLLVHCSAGIGRTGLFAGCLMSLHLIKQGISPSPTGIVQNMRSFRTSMVQAWEQFNILCTFIVRHNPKYNAPGFAWTTYWYKDKQVQPVYQKYFGQGTNVGKGQEEYLSQKDRQTQQYGYNQYGNYQVNGQQQQYQNYQQNQQYGYNQYGNYQGKNQQQQYQNYQQKQQYQNNQQKTDPNINEYLKFCKQIYAWINAVIVPLEKSPNPKDPGKTLLFFSWCIDSLSEVMETMGNNTGMPNWGLPRGKMDLRTGKSPVQYALTLSNRKNDVKTALVNWSKHNKEHFKIYYQINPKFYSDIQSIPETLLYHSKYIFDIVDDIIAKEKRKTEVYQKVGESEYPDPYEDEPDYLDPNDERTIIHKEIRIGESNKINNKNQLKDPINRSGAVNYIKKHIAANLTQKDQDLYEEYSKAASWTKTIFNAWMNDQISNLQIIIRDAINAYKDGESKNRLSHISGPISHIIDSFKYDGNPEIQSNFKDENEMKKYLTDWTEWLENSNLFLAALYSEDDIVVKKIGKLVEIIKSYAEKCIYKY